MTSPQGYRVEMCRSCMASIVWATSAKTGRVMPMDAQPSDTGTFVLRAGLRPGQLVAVFDPNAADALIPEPKHTSHFATCPDADTWRKRDRS